MNEKLSQEQLLEFVKMNQRRLIINNTTQQEITAHIVFTSTGGQEAKETVSLTAHQLGKIPFFTDGTCSVTIDGATQIIEMDTPLEEYELVITYNDQLEEVEA